jgi:hypothetical protein
VITDVQDPFCPRRNPLIATTNLHDEQVGSIAGGDGMHEAFSSSGPTVTRDLRGWVHLGGKVAEA